LRWWYEAIVRGLGGRACDPTIHVCSLSDENLKKFERARDSGKSPDEAIKETDVCSACQLFGTTGWRRRFRLIVDDADLNETWSNGAVNIKPPERNRGWYLNAGKMGTFHLKIVADENTQARILALIQFVARWGSIGARPQLGYGFLEIVEIKNPPQSIYNWDDVDNGQNKETLPDLYTFTFFSLNFEPQRGDWWGDVPGIGSLARNNRYRNAMDGLLHYHLMPTTPALKNVLRYGQQWSSGALPHQFFGTLRGNERSRSKIAISWAYQLPNSPLWQIRGWAYPPQVSPKQQQEIQQRLQTVLMKPETWLRALKIRYRSAEVSFAPTTTFFQSITSTQVQRFLRETLPARV